MSAGFPADVSGSSHSFVSAAIGGVERGRAGVVGVVLAVGRFGRVWRAVWVGLPSVAGSSPRAFQCMSAPAACSRSSTSSLSSLLISGRGGGSPSRTSCTTSSSSPIGTSGYDVTPASRPKAGRCGSAGTGRWFRVLAGGSSCCRRPSRLRGCRGRLRSAAPVAAITESSPELIMEIPHLRG
jgi:hypothetical protein